MAAYLIGFFAMLAIAACGGERNAEPPPKPAVILPGQETVLARVNDSAITLYDVDQSILTSLGAQSMGMLDADGRRKVLESLLAGRAIAQSQAMALNEEENAVLDLKVAAYREQMLIKMYLAANTSAEPVSQQMVEEYYKRHPEQFGARTVRRYEMINSSAAAPEVQRDRILAALNNAAQQKDWAKLVERLKGQGLSVQYASGQINPKVLQPKLRDLMSPLKPGETSALTFIDTSVHIVRIVDEHRIPARPLNEVSAQIRKMLLPVQLKKAVKQASEQVLAQAKVEYFTD